MMSLPVWLPGSMFLMGVSVKGVICPGGVICQGDPAYGEQGAVRILLEFFLAS